TAFCRSISPMSRRRTWTICSGRARSSACADAWAQPQAEDLTTSEFVQPLPVLAAGELGHGALVLRLHGVAFLAEPADDLHGPLGQLHHAVLVVGADAHALLRGVGDHGGLEQRHVPPVRLVGRNGAHAEAVLAPQPVEDALDEDGALQARPWRRVVDDDVVG